MGLLQDPEANGHHFKVITLKAAIPNINHKELSFPKEATGCSATQYIIDML
jgi:hypothetical protein